MQERYDYKRFAVLYVDDEEKSLKLFDRAFGGTFRVFTAATARQGLERLEAHRDEIGILMTDQRMPGEKGVWLLDRARQLEPRMLRILVTAYTDMDAAIEAVNTGAIYKYVSKPWDPEQLEQTLKRGLQFFLVQHERDELLKEKIAVLRNVMITDMIVSLGVLSAGLSHHIRNALQAVKTFLDLAPAKMQEERMEMEGLRNPEFWKEYHQNAQGQIQKINSLLLDLGFASQDRSAEFNDVICLRPLATGVIQGLENELARRKLHVINDVPEDLPPMTADKPKITRLFQLLLKDEIVSLPEDCTVSLAARLLPASGQEAAQIEVQVRDNGPGLPREAVGSLFSPFVVRGESPIEYGINLMACYFIVYHHGGTIQAQSQEGQGTTLTIRLPLKPGAAPQIVESAGFLQKLLLNEALWGKLSSQ